MKHFNRANLPQEIKYNGKKYYCLGSDSPDLRTAHKANQSFVIVNVLQRNLKGREDLHGKIYQPRPFLYGCIAH